MNYYLITLELIIGGYEKHTRAVIRALDEKIAKAYALYAECHDTDGLTWGDDQVEDLGGEMVYKIDSCEKLCQEDTNTLERCHIAAFTAYTRDLKEAGHPDFQEE